MDDRTSREFSLEAHRKAMSDLPSAHQDMAHTIYTYSTEVLNSRPYHEAKSFQSGNGRKLVLKTKVNDSYWLVLHMSKKHLWLEFPDKYGDIDSFGVFAVEAAPKRQAATKKNKVVKNLPLEFSSNDFKDAVAFIDGIHATCVVYYSRSQDSTETARLKYGEPKGSSDNIPLPGPEMFEELLQRSQGCETCRELKGLSLWFGDDNWFLYCDAHHPQNREWIDQARRSIPEPVRRSVWHRDGGRCECGSDMQIQFDHIIPVKPSGLMISGSNCKTNIRLRCRACNLRKGNKLIP